MAVSSKYTQDLSVPIVFFTFSFKWFHLKENVKKIFAYSSGSAEYSTELAFNTRLPNLIDLNVAFYMHLIQQLDLVQVKCDV